MEATLDAVAKALRLPAREIAELASVERALADPTRVPLDAILDAPAAR